MDFREIFERQAMPSNCLDSLSDPLIRAFFHAVELIAVRNLDILRHVLQWKAVSANIEGLCCRFELSECILVFLCDRLPDTSLMALKSYERAGGEYTADQ